MSALTFATARLEETWGHDQDIADALGVRRTDTDRLRHVADTDLVVEGPMAGEWMEIAQAIADPPGSGRRPGQFPRVGTASG